MAERLRAVSLARGCMMYLLTATWLMGMAAVVRESLVVAAPWGPLDLTGVLSPAGFALVSALYVVACAGFLLRRSEVLACGVLLVLLAALGLTEKAIRHATMPTLAVMLATTMVGTWMIGLIVGRRAPTEEREALAHELMCGVLSASLFLCGVAKLSNVGFAWADGPNNALLIHERSASEFAFITQLRLWLSQHPTLCALGATFSLAVETLAPVYLWRGARKVYGLAVFLMFVSLGFALGFMEAGWDVLPLALAYSSLADRRPVSPPTTA